MRRLVFVLGWTLGWLALGAGLASVAAAHDLTLAAFLRARRAAEFEARGNRESEPAKDEKLCQLRIKAIDADSKRPLPALVRLINPDTGKEFLPRDGVKRELNWFALEAGAAVQAPPKKWRVQITHGLEHGLATREIDLSGKTESSVEAALPRFYNAKSENWRGGNTHLHLMRLTHAEAARYMTLVPQADGLELLFVSNLRRIPDERTYITNQFTRADFQRLSQPGKVLLVNGEEHRHNFGRGGEGFGHVMFLDIPQLVRPVSIGPGIMRSGTDGPPLQRGIRQARRDGGTVVWCHNTFGFEDIPNWLAGLVHAQNIFDGGSHGWYEDALYRFLDIGLKAPISTGTDWFMYDFSRVYVHAPGKLTSRSWRKAFSDGRSYITNGVFLEFTAGGKPIGDTLSLAGPTEIEVKARGVGRNSFSQIELVYNGQVVAQAAAAKSGPAHEATLTAKLKLDKPGWLALRLPKQAGKNEFGKELFAHTSPIYVEIAGRRIFRPEVAKEMLVEVKEGMQTILKKGMFKDDAERESVVRVYQQAIEELNGKLKR